MMQATDLVLDLILIFTFIIFYVTVAWGLIHYSKRQGYRIWAIGWLVYTVGALQGGFASSPVGLSPLDFIAINTMFIGITLIQDGIRTTEITKNRLRFYAGGVTFFTCFLLLGLIFELGFQYVFMPLGFYVAYVCIFSARVVLRFEATGHMSNWWLVLGFMIWAGSWFIVPFTIINFSLFDLFVTLQALGVIITASSMLTMFTGTVTRDLENQYQISNIISGLVQHDIRNYIQTARNALELTEREDVMENHWINIANEVLEDAGNFVDEMRDIIVSINQAKIASEKIPLSLTIEKVVERVIKEYSLTPEQIEVQIPMDTMIDNSRLVDELLWNILDNSFKHGSPSLFVSAKVTQANIVELDISDRGGGLSEELKAFLNSTESLKKPDQPLVGLGMLLIRGIASLCGISLHVTDNIADMSVIGTTYHLRFNESK
jgi:signal transduction histidine kinase